MLGILYAGVQGLLSAEEEVVEGGHAEEAPNPILPETVELIVGAICFIIVFTVIAKFAFPRMKEALKERTERIEGEMQKAEDTRGEADQILEQYRQQLANARDEANRIIEEARQTAEAMRKDLTEKAERDSQAIVARAQDEIKAERDRAFADLKAQVGELSVELAPRVVGESLDRERQLRLVDQYIDDLTRSSSGSDGGGSEGGAGGGS